MSILLILSWIAVFFLVGKITLLANKIRNRKARLAANIILTVASVMGYYFFGVYTNPTIAEVAIALVANTLIAYLEVYIRHLANKTIMAEEPVVA